jgi:hypothetical protein
VQKYLEAQSKYIKKELDKMAKETGVGIMNVTAKKLALSLLQRLHVDLLRHELTLQGLVEGEDFSSSTGIAELKKILWEKLRWPESETYFTPSAKR